MIPSGGGSKTVLTFAQNMRRNVEIPKNFTKVLTTCLDQKQQDTTFASFVSTDCLPYWNKREYDYSLKRRYDGHRQASIKSGFAK